MTYLKDYTIREKTMKTSLWIFQIPVLLCWPFTYSCQGLIINHERNEIAVMKSRGSSSFQIFRGYAAEGAVLSAVAFILGPPIGLGICKILGSSNGFLEFVNRSSLPVSLGLNAYTYALITLALFMVTMLMPAFLASRVSIVQHKQKKARAGGRSLWKKAFIDIIFLE